MIRRIIQIDEEKCNGCGACAAACHESAIGMVDGKAKLLRDDYCDGLGDCLPACPTGAITFVEREAAAYDEAAVLAKPEKSYKITIPAPAVPVQIKLVPTNAPYFDGAETPDRGRLHRLRLRKLPRRFYQRQDRPGRLSEAGCRRLQ